MDPVSNLTSKLKIDSNSFSPTDAHRKAKAAFWAHFLDSGEQVPDSIDIVTAARYSGYNSVFEWWEIKGFAEWFQNGEEFRQKVEYISSLGLDLLQSVLLDVTAKTADRLNAAKMALEIASKFPKSQPKDAPTGGPIDDMNKKQLEEFIASKLAKITPKSE